MLGKLRTWCLGKYVRTVGVVCRTMRCKSRYLSTIVDICATRRSQYLDYLSSVEHNDEDTGGTVPPRKLDGIRLGSAYAPSAGLAGTRRGPPPPTGCDRSTLSRQRVLRPERSGTDQVRDATQRREGRAR